MKKMIIPILLVGFVLTSSTSSGQIYIVFDGIKGESSFRAFANSTELNSLSWGAKNTATIGSEGGRAGMGKVQTGEMVITKPRGSSSSALQMFVFNGKYIPKAEIRFYKQAAGAQTPYLTITLENVLVSSWSVSAEGNSAPMETFSLNFAKFKTEDSSMKPDGTMEKQPAVGWDIQRNQSY